MKKKKNFLVQDDGKTIEECATLKEAKHSIDWHVKIFGSFRAKHLTVLGVREGRVLYKMEQKTNG